jgi:hypothetical protein
MGSVKIRGQSFYFNICAKYEKWQSPGTRSTRARQAQVFGIWPVARRISEMWRSGGQSIHIIASRTARELPSARNPAVSACTLNAALYPYSLTRNERAGAALLRAASLVYYLMMTRTTLSLWLAQDENSSIARNISDQSNNCGCSCTRQSSRCACRNDGTDRNPTALRT